MQCKLTSLASSDQRQNLASFEKLILRSFARTANIFCWFAVCIALLGATEAKASPYTVTLVPVGSNIVATGSGQIDLTGLIDFGSTPTGLPNGGMHPAGGGIAMGSASSAEVYFIPSLINYLPNNFGVGDTTAASSGSGDYTLFSFQFSHLYLPVGYVTETPLSNSNTYNNATFASLGISSGGYQWSWGPGADQSFTIVVSTPASATPIPAALPLFASGLGVLGLLGWRRKKKAQAAAA
jgi:hypothetical protein